MRRALVVVLLVGAVAWWWNRGEPVRGNHAMEGLSD